MKPLKALLAGAFKRYGNVSSILKPVTHLIRIQLDKLKTTGKYYVVRPPIFI